VIVGGSTAGASAATKARRTNEDAEITIFEQGPYASFAGCGLPYYVGGEVRDVNDLSCLSQKNFHTRYRIRVGLRQEVAAIDRAGRRVHVKDLTTGNCSWHPFDRLILAHSAPPLLPSVPGIDLLGVFSLSTVPDTEALRSYVLSDQVRQVAVIGGGFSGFEVMEALLNLGLEVHLVGSASHLMSHMDWEMAVPVAEHLRTEGVKLHLGAEPVVFIGETRLERLELSTGEVVPVQLAVVANGLPRELSLAREAGLEIGPNGGVLVDDRMRTSDPDIYACGDMAEVVHCVSGKRVRLSLPGPANREGRVAGSNAAGGNLRFGGVIGTCVVKACYLSVGKTGLSEAEARQVGFEPIATYTHNHSIPDYMREAEIMAIKLVAERRSGRLLGAQIVGGQGVDKRTDVLATAIQAGMTVEELEGIDLACSPPYSSEKDPVVMAAFATANRWRGEVETVSVQDRGAGDGCR